MNFRNYTPKHRIEIGIIWLFLVHGLLNVAVGLYRCHNVAPGLTDHLATVLPGAQTCLLVFWLFRGPANLSKRLCGFIAGHMLIFLVYSNLLLPGFRSMRYANWQWSYFDFSGPGNWLVKLPVLLIAVGSAFLLAEIVRRWGNRHAEPDKTTNHTSIKQPLIQFDVADLLVWTIVCCLALAVHKTPTDSGWMSMMVGIWTGAYEMKTIADWCTISAAALWAVAFFWVLICSQIRDLSNRIVIQVALAVVAGLIFDWLFQLLQPTNSLPQQLFLTPSFVLIVSSSLIVIEILGDPNFGQYPQASRAQLKKIGTPILDVETGAEATYSDMPSIKIDMSI